MQSDKREILAICLGALGDFVLSWPCLGLLAGGPPPGNLSILGQAQWCRLILPPERVFDRESGRFAGLYNPEPHERLDPWLKGFQLAAVFARRPPRDLVAHLEAAVDGPVWTIPTKPRPGDPTHAAQVQLSRLRELGLTGPAQAPPVILPAVTPPPAPVVAPGSGGKTKRLDPFLAADLARMLGKKRKAAPWIILGPAEERAYRAALTRALSGVDHQIMIEPPMDALAARLSTASPYLGVDSGVTHLAAALGAPVLAAFGPSDPRVWAPVGPRVKLINIEQLEEQVHKLMSSGGLEQGSRQL